MTRTLPANPSLSLLKKQAKKLLKQFREGNVLAVASVNTHHPRPDAFTGLRDAQLVIARSYTYANWSELCEAVQIAQDGQNTLADNASLFIRLGCVQYSGNDSLRNYQRARRLVTAFPDIAEFDVYSALVANNATAVSNFLESDPTLAVTTGGPLSWPPLLYVTYSRVGEQVDSRSSLSIARQLIEYGASPNSHIILNEQYRFTALTGAMGEGENGVNQPAHPQADEMVELLLDAGANPNDGQGLYNTMFTNSVDKWLTVLLGKGLRADDMLNWNATGDDAKVTTLNFQLASAVAGNCLPRVQTLLSAGASAGTRNTYNGRLVHTNALLAGCEDIAQLLENHGAIPEKLGTEEQFVLACVQENDELIGALLDDNPELTGKASLLHAAADNASLRMVKLLVSYGFDINAQAQYGRTLLHQYALKNDCVSIKQLLSLGARADIRDSSHNAIAAVFAAYSVSFEAMRLLLDASDSLLDAASGAYLEKVQSLVDNDSALLKSRTEQGNTVLHVIGYWLQQEPEYEVYQSLVQWLVSAGADVHAKNRRGQTPYQFHLANGFDTLADLFEEYG
ncbi:MAG: ankyrin repeat domain-containing protein [Granulosicoccus sp.]